MTDMLPHSQKPPPLWREALGRALRLRRTEMGLTLAQVSQRSGVSTQFLSEIERGLKDPSSEVIEAVAAVNPATVVVLAGGGAISTPWLGAARALVHGYLGGQAGAGGVLDVLTGTVNPSGRLAETLPVRLADTPTAASFYQQLHMATAYWYDADELVTTCLSMREKIRASDISARRAKLLKRLRDSFSQSVSTPP